MEAAPRQLTKKRKVEVQKKGGPERRELGRREGKPSREERGRSRREWGPLRRGQEVGAGKRLRARPAWRH